MRRVVAFAQSLMEFVGSFSLQQIEKVFRIEAVLAMRGADINEGLKETLNMVIVKEVNRPVNKTLEGVRRVLLLRRTAVEDGNAQNDRFLPQDAAFTLIESVSDEVERYGLELNQMGSVEGAVGDDGRGSQTADSCTVADGSTQRESEKAQEKEHEKEKEIDRQLEMSILRQKNALEKGSITPEQHKRSVDILKSEAEEQKKQLREELTSFLQQQSEQQFALEQQSQQYQQLYLISSQPPPPRFRVNTSRDAFPPVLIPRVVFNTEQEDSQILFNILRCVKRNPSEALVHPARLTFIASGTIFQNIVAPPQQTQMMESLTPSSSLSSSSSSSATPSPPCFPSTSAVANALSDISGILLSCHCLFDEKTLLRFYLNQNKQYFDGEGNERNNKMKILSDDEENNENYEAEDGNDGKEEEENNDAERSSSRSKCDDDDVVDNDGFTRMQPDEESDDEGNTEEEKGSLLQANKATQQKT
ncbi:uncharacterized protein MONOS_18433 [Monocercomonoides exilis]|uniref:uncharacterized protein n=1 Tax=Monocercomonoides exilis TaxID=2049356 RepID=UPI00355A0B33|nr:hypothetical protein MONOS_18433 [Monocercomonoides exilis]